MRRRWSQQEFAETITRSHARVASEAGSRVPEAPASSSAVRPEQEAGAALIQWIDMVVLPDGTRPGEYFAHNANGGARTAIEGAILKGQGVRKGWPDYTLYLPRGGYHGLVLELKAEHGDKPTDEQLDILVRLQRQGYYACVAWGFLQAKEQIGTYLAGSKA